MAKIFDEYKPKDYSAEGIEAPMSGTYKAPDQFAPDPTKMNPQEAQEIQIARLLKRKTQALPGQDKKQKRPSFNFMEVLQRLGY